MSLKSIVLFFLMSFPFWGMCTPQTDSLYMAFQQEAQIEKKTQLAIQLGKALYQEGAIDSSIHYFQYPLHVDNEKVGLAQKGNCRYWLGFIYHQRSDNTSAAIEWTQALALYKSIEHEDMQARMYSNLGYCYTILGSLGKANKMFDLAESIYLRQDSPKHLQVFYHNRGLAYWKENRLEDAIYYLKKAIDHDEIDLLRKGQVLNLLGTCYRDQGNFTKSRNTYTTALAIAQEIESVELFATVQNQLGRWHEVNEHWDSANTYYKKAILAVQDYHYPVIEANAKMNLARVLAQQAQATEALTHVAEVLVLANEYEDKTDFLAALELGIRLGNQQGDQQLVTHYFDLLLSHTTPTYEHNSKTKQLADNAEVEKNLLQLELDKWRAKASEVPLFTRSFLAGLLILLIIGGVYGWLRAKVRLQTAYEVQEKMREEIQHYQREKREQAAAQQQRKAEATEHRRQFLEEWLDLNTEEGKDE